MLCPVTWFEGWHQNINLRKISTSPTCLVGNSSINSLFPWAKPRVHACPVKVQITLESKIPNLQVLLQFNSSNISNLVNQASPDQAGTSLVSMTCGVGKSQEMGAKPPGLSVTTWETWGEGPQQHQRMPSQPSRTPNPDPFHQPEPALHGTSSTSLISKNTTVLPSFSKLLFDLSSLYYELAALGDLYLHLENIKCHCHFNSHVLLRSASLPWAQWASGLPVYLTQ